MKNRDSFSYYLMKYFSDFLPNQVAASIHTIHSYRDTFVQLMIFFKDIHGILPEHISYEKLSADKIEEFLLWLETERHIGIKTRNQRLAAIHAFFRYIQYRDPAGFEQCSQILSIPFKKAPIQAVSYMTVEEMTALFALPNTGTPQGLRDLALLTTLYESGSRVQELIDLSTSSIRLGKINTLEVHGKGNKTRLVPINADVARIVKRYMDLNGPKGSTEPLFVNRNGYKLTRSGIQYIIDKYVSAAQQEHPEMFRKKVTPHSFRHSKAMHLLESGVNLVYIRDFLGHTSVMTTEIYARTNPKIKEEQLSRNSKKITPGESYTVKEKDDLIDWLKKNL